MFSALPHHPCLPDRNRKVFRAKT